MFRGLEYLTYVHYVLALQIVEDDLLSESGKSMRRSTTSDKVAEGGPRPGAGGGEGAKSGNPAAARMLLPALKEVVAGLASQYELMKEVVAAVQVCTAEFDVRCFQGVVTLLVVQGLLQGAAGCMVVARYVSSGRCAKMHCCLHSPTLNGVPLQARLYTTVAGSLPSCHAADLATSGVGDCAGHRAGAAGEHDDAAGGSQRARGPQAQPGRGRAPAHRGAGLPHILPCAMS